MQGKQVVDNLGNIVLDNSDNNVLSWLKQEGILSETGSLSSLISVLSSLTITDSITSSELIGGLFRKLIEDTANSSERMLAIVRFPEIPKLIFPLSKKLFFDNDVLSYTGGKEQRVLRLDEEKYKIGLTYSSLTLSDKNKLATFFNDIVEGRKEAIFKKMSLT